MRTKYFPLDLAVSALINLLDVFSHKPAGVYERGLRQIVAIWMIEIERCRRRAVVVRFRVQVEKWKPLLVCWKEEISCFRIFSVPNPIGSLKEDVATFSDELDRFFVKTRICAVCAILVPSVEMEAARARFATFDCFLCDLLGRFWNEELVGGPRTPAVRGDGNCDELPSHVATLYFPSGIVTI